MKSTPFAPLTPTPSAVSTPCPKYVYFLVESSPWMRPRVRCFAAAGVNFWMATPREAAYIKTWAMGWQLRVSSTTCRCSLKKPPPCLITWVNSRWWCCMATLNLFCKAFHKMRKSVFAWPKVTQNVLFCPPRICF